MALRSSVDAGAGGSLVTSVTGTAGQIQVTPTTGAAVVSALRVYTYASPANQPSTTSTSLVMLGIGGSWKLTPLKSGRVKLTVSGSAASSLATAVTNIQIAYGTGTAPSNGAAATGTVVTNTATQSTNANNNQLQSFSIYAEVPGLTLNTAYWFDLQFDANFTGTSSIQNVNVLAEEAIS